MTTYINACIVEKQMKFNGPKGHIPVSNGEGRLVWIAPQDILLENKEWLFDEPQTTSTTDMVMYSEYTVITHTSIERLVQTVNNALKEGWKTLGGITYAENLHTMCKSPGYCQAMIRE